MSYIPLSKRANYEPIIRAMKKLYDSPDPQEAKGEFFGYFLYNAVAKFVQPNHMPEPVFSAHNFTQDQKSSLNSSLNLLFGETKDKHHMEAIDDLSYVLSAILWGYMGQMSNDPNKQTSLGMRSYLLGFILETEDMLRNLRSKITNPANQLMAVRRHLLAKGFLSTFLLESQRVNNDPFNDVQRRNNGDVWVNGVIQMPEVDKRLPHEKV